MKSFLICFSIIAAFSVCAMAYFSITDTQSRSTAFNDSPIKYSDAMASLNNTITKTLTTDGKCK